MHNTLWGHRVAWSSTGNYPSGLGNPRLRTAALWALGEFKSGWPHRDRGVVWPIIPGSGPGDLRCAAQEFKAFE